MSVPKIAKQRDSNIELFRIVTMLLIVASHYNFSPAPLKAADPDSVNIFYCFWDAIRNAFNKIEIQVI